jgi:hypothetical protein
MTVTANTTLKSALDLARPGQVDDILAKMKLGTMLTPLKRVFASLTASATMDLTALDGTGETVGTGNGNRRSVLALNYLRVDASGTAASVGNYIVGPPTSTLLVPPGGANTAVGVARLSDDGKTLTFPNTITGFTIWYIPASAVDMTAVQAAFDTAP